jgi:hypothetical protein
MSQSSPVRDTSLLHQLSIRQHREKQNKKIDDAGEPAPEDGDIEELTLS